MFLFVEKICIKCPLLFFPDNDYTMSGGTYRLNGRCISSILFGGIVEYFN